MRAWDAIERWLIGLLGAGALLVGTYQVIGRYIAPEYASGWSDEVTVYLAVWAIFLATSQLVRTDGHVRPDLVLRLLRPPVQRRVEIFNCLVALAFCVGLVWFGIAIVRDAYALDERSETVLAFPMWVYYAAMPTGAVLMAARYAIRLYRYLFRFDPRTMAIFPAHDT
ncbi:MAG: TRAP transporter small permease [Alphaproteobacteria bacterium]|nr:TRAP transporter small permease [Alphaproteobacteria bacterium]MBV9861454.1 TRAP transporter small permease [Alphaproteobacteria bacterium]